MAKPKDPISLFLSNIGIIILIAVAGIALLTVTVVYLIIHQLLLAVIVALFFAIIEGVGVRFGFIKVEAYKWMPLLLLFLPFIGFFAGYGLEMRGFFAVTPLDAQPPIPAYSTTAVATNATILMIIAFLVITAIAIFVKPKQP